MRAIDFLASSNYIAVNKDVLRSLGIDEAIILGEIANEQKILERVGKVDTFGYFVLTVESVEYSTGLTAKRQRSALKSLKNNGIIDYSLKGCPPVRVVRINEDGLIYFFGQFSQLVQNGLFKESKMDYLKKEEKSLIKKNKEILYNNIKERNLKEYKYISFIKERNENDVCESVSEAINAEFDTLWAMYPIKIGKHGARFAYVKAREQGTTFEEVKNGLERYLDLIRITKRQSNFIKYGENWFKNREWLADYKVVEESSKPVSNAFKTRNYTKEDLDALIDDIENVEI